MEHSAKNDNTVIAKAWKRPRIITAICILAYGNIILAFLKVFSPSVKKLGMLMPAIYGTIVAAHFISCVGIWYFKQWGVQLYVISFFAKVLFFLLFYQLNFGFYYGVVLSTISILILLRFYPKMSPNL